MRGFEIVCEYLEVPPSPDVFFFLFTLTRPTNGRLTTGWLSFRVHTNRKVFLLYEKSFHHFKPMYFKVFGAPSLILFWESLEMELLFNYVWSKHCDVPRVEESNLKPQEQLIARFFLQHFGKNHLNLKNLMGVDPGKARRYLGLFLDLVFSFLFSLFLAWMMIFCR